MKPALLALDEVSYSYRGAKQPALQQVSLSLFPGSSLGIVGESGSGKSTALGLLLQLLTPGAGRVLFDGEPITDRKRLRALRRAVQPVFQDPYASLNPRLRVSRIVAEPLVSLGIETAPAARRERVTQALGSVGLGPDTLDRYPHEFSGGQRQRIAIARALVTEPKVLVADEPVSALDVTTRIEIIELLARLRAERELSLIMVSHDLSVVAALCEQSLVLSQGKVVEAGPTMQLLKDPQQDYTKALIAAIPRLPQ